MNFIFQILPTIQETKTKVDTINLIIQVLLLLALIFLMIASTPIFVFFSIAIIPSIISMFLDRKNTYRFESSTISAFNFIGLFPYLVKLVLNWQNSSDVAINFLTDIQTWLVIYGSALIGKLIYIIFPIMISRWQIQGLNKKKFMLIDQKNELSRLWSINSSTASKLKNVK
jgi:hypothetical protein